MADRIQMVGSEMDLMSGPNEQMLDTFGGGTVEAIYDPMDLGRRSNPLGVFTMQSMGQEEWVGSTVGDLKRAPHRGYESGQVNNAQTPINRERMAPDTPESF